MLKEYGHLRNYRILKSDDEFNKVFEKRLERLDNWKPKISSGLKKDFNECIKLTIDCHQTAKLLTESKKLLISTLPHNDKEVTERAIFFIRQTEKTDAFLKEMKFVSNPVELTKKREFEFQKAKEIVLESSSVRWQKKEKSMMDFTKNRLGNVDSSFHSGIIQKVSLITITRKSYLGAIQSSFTAMGLADTFTGLLYMGVIDIEGGKLDKKVWDDHMKKINDELVSAVVGVALSTATVAAVGAWMGEPQLGQYISLGISAVKIGKETYKAINEFRNVDVIPETVENAIFVEQFISKYQSALQEWKYRTIPIISSMNKFTSVTNQYIG